jgi:hypothetical protein
MLTNALFCLSIMSDSILSCSIILHYKYYIILYCINRASTSTSTSSGRLVFVFISHMYCSSSCSWSWSFLGLLPRLAGSRGTRCHAPCPCPGPFHCPRHCNCHCTCTFTCPCACQCFGAFLGGPGLAVTAIVCGRRESLLLRLRCLGGGADIDRVDLRPCVRDGLSRLCLCRCC